MQPGGGNWGPGYGGYGPPPSGYGPQGYGPPPGYGGYPPKPPGMSTGMKVLIGCLCVFGGCVMLSVAGSSKSKSNSSTSADRTTETKRDTQTKSEPIFAAPKPKEPDVTVDAMTLWKEYEQNEVSADNRYKGKKILVTGTVTGITKDFTDDIIVQLASPNEFMPTRLYDVDAQTAGSLSKGQKFTALCECEGRIVGSPVLKECEAR